MIEENKNFPKIKEFILDRFGFYTRMMFNNNDLFELKLYTREMINNTIFDLVFRLFGKKQEQTVTLKTPNTWWNWFKMKHMHKKWMWRIVQKFPIKFDNHNYVLNEYTTFPDIVIPKDFSENHIKIMFYDHKEIEEKEEK